jgi:molybdopterin synthase sulfur carrier subunit
MKVTVKLFATLRDYGLPYQEIEVAENVTVGDVVQTLGLPDKTPLLIIINGKFYDLEHPVKDNDVIALFPPIAGG